MDDARLVQRSGAIEPQLRLISEHLAPAGPATQAISRLRQLMGASLLSAKRAVDAL